MLETIVIGAFLTLFWTAIFSLLILSIAATWVMIIHFIKELFKE